jgi:uncharacterized repeat protein (TIGR01451 family)
MKNFKVKKNIGLSFLFVMLVFGSGAAFALPPQPPDIRVQVTGPATAMVNSPYQYTVNVRNIGGAKANGVTVFVDFPQTNTSPQVFILGQVSAIGTGCQLVSRRLQCSAGNLNPNAQRNFTFNFSYPVSTKPLEIKATGTSTSTNEVNPTNNIASYFPAIGYPTNQISSANVLVSLCTGTNLSSYYECELFPSSQQFFTMTLDSGGAISNLPEPGYTGTWTQTQTTNQPFQQLQFTISDGYTSASFDGYASSTTCFEGKTTFLPTSNYSSQYKVCVQ